MRIAYADPPYPGQAKRHYGRFGGVEVNHRLLIAHLCSDYPDGWALSTSSSALRYVLSLIPAEVDVRISPWVKPFAVFYANPAYCWEPVIWSGGRKRKGRNKANTEPTVRDWVSANAMMPSTSRQKREVHVPGEKPEAFSFWLFELMGLRRGDTFDDLFPGSGAVSAAWERWRHGLWVA